MAEPPALPEAGRCTRRTSSSARLQLWQRRVSIEGTATPGIVSCVHRREGVRRKRIAKHQGPGARSWHADLGFARLCVKVSGILFKPGESDRAVLICLQLARRKPFDRLPRPLCRRFGLRPLHVRLGRHRGPGRCAVPRRLQNHTASDAALYQRLAAPCSVAYESRHMARCQLPAAPPKTARAARPTRALPLPDKKQFQPEAKKLRDAHATPSYTAAGGSVAPTSPGPAAESSLSTATAVHSPLGAPRSPRLLPHLPNFLLPALRNDQI